MNFWLVICLTHIGCVLRRIFFVSRYLCDMEPCVQPPCHFVISSKPMHIQQLVQQLLQMTD
jgi:hypothetical protein